MAATVNEARTVSAVPAHGWVVPSGASCARS